MPSNVAPAALQPFKPRLCFMSYRHIRQFAMPVIAEYHDRADIELVDGVFTDALMLARERLARGQVDAFVSAGSNASVLRKGLQAPVATIQLTGFDLLQALIRARRIADRVGIVMYGQTIPELDAVKGLLNVEVQQYAYHTPADARERFEQLRREGYRVIIGSSLVVELAEECGLAGLLAYSLASVRRGIDDAIELARVARLEASRYELLHGVLDNLQEAVLAVDGLHRITAVNPPMQALLGLPAEGLLGRALEQVEPELSLQATLQRGVAERGAVLRFGQRDWIAHRTPIREQGSPVGAALMLYDARDIEAADTSLRLQQRRRQATARHDFGGLVGEAPAFQRAVQAARRFARTDLTVLLTGESGTGKELFAQAIHNESARAARPFIAVNCASFPESLLESELFGYEEGAFTGARRGGKRGLVEAAHTGTLFLDEIGDMPMALQSRLLRVLQEREVTRLGGSSAIPVDLRVIAATHQPLAERVAQRQFREDLFYRLNTLRLPLPPLRERREDIAALAVQMVQRGLGRLGVRRDAGAMLGPVLPALYSYDWPGNVRELQNICERLAVFFSAVDRPPEADCSELRAECPELFAGARGVLAPALPAATQAERVAEAMRNAGQNRLEAARLLGVSRSTLWRWLREQKAPPTA
ncbi:propionate catabolism operon regulatory protein PrpR [Pseudorhodoferax sp. Leaf274]|uniref:propionate catabolism operon regulatory protein PrpR n=1 Tax=Pseudorhodoferax sp. Leaf274 TaxID=1736318 RepID=UPI0007038FBD|nr:propionate catabolism operon regulatory protein PrpR [Pseudorhodoferax sp. Leaf274]KQP35762.1 propionate catabolism operon regulatory protein PrpR [Pseudorhodoferax sp. Leaf274]